MLTYSAQALAALGETTQAYRHVGISQELWLPTRTDRTGDLDIGHALLEFHRGRLDTAEQFAAASVRH